MEVEQAEQPALQEVEPASPPPAEEQEKREEEPMTEAAPTPMVRAALAILSCWPYSSCSQEVEPVEQMVALPKSLPTAVVDRRHREGRFVEYLVEFAAKGRRKAMRLWADVVLLVESYSQLSAVTPGKLGIVEMIEVWDSANDTDLSVLHVIDEKMEQGLVAPLYKIMWANYPDAFCNWEVRENMGRDVGKVEEYLLRRQIYGSGNVENPCSAKRRPVDQVPILVRDEGEEAYEGGAENGSGQLGGEEEDEEEDEDENQREHYAAAAAGQYLSQAHAHGHAMLQQQQQLQQQQPQSQYQMVQDEEEDEEEEDEVEEEEEAFGPAAVRKSSPSGNDGETTRCEFCLASFKARGYLRHLASKHREQWLKVKKLPRPPSAKPAVRRKSRTVSPRTVSPTGRGAGGSTKKAKKDDDSNGHYQQQPQTQQRHAPPPPPPAAAVAAANNRYYQAAPGQPHQQPQTVQKTQKPQYGQHQPQQKVTYAELLAMVSSTKDWSQFGQEVGQLLDRVDTALMEKYWRSIVERGDYPGKLQKVDVALMINWVKLRFAVLLSCLLSDWLFLQGTFFSPSFQSFLWLCVCVWTCACAVFSCRRCPNRRPPPRRSCASCRCPSTLPCRPPRRNAFLPSWRPFERPPPPRVPFCARGRAPARSASSEARPDGCPRPLRQLVVQRLLRSLVVHDGHRGAPYAIFAHERWIQDVDLVPKGNPAFADHEPRRFQLNVLTLGIGNVGLARAPPPGASSGARTGTGRRQQSDPDELALFEVDSHHVPADPRLESANCEQLLQRQQSGMIPSVVRDLDFDLESPVFPILVAVASDEPLRVRVLVQSAHQRQRHHALSLLYALLVESEAFCTGGDLHTPPSFSLAFFFFFFFPFSIVFPLVYVSDNHWKRCGRKSFASAS